MKTLVVLTLSALIGLAQAQTPLNSNLERELTRRALGADYDGSIQVSVLPGKLPPNLPSALPSLPSSQLIGSVLRTSSNPNYPYSLSVYQDSSLNPAALLESVRSSLQKSGWKEFKAFNYSGAGFLSANPGVANEFYLLGKQLTLSVFAIPNPKGSQIIFNLLKSKNIDERLGFETRRSENPTLPALRPPTGATVSPSGSSGGGSNWNNTAQIGSSLPLETLLEGYAAQLRKAGWREVGRNRAGSALTTVWAFEQKGQALTGILGLREDGKGQFSALLSTSGFR